MSEQWADLPAGRYYTIRGVARMLRMSHTWVRQKIVAGQIDAVRIADMRLIRAEDMPAVYWPMDTCLHCQRRILGGWFVDVGRDEHSEWLCSACCEDRYPEKWARRIERTGEMQPEKEVA